MLRHSMLAVAMIMIPSACFSADTTIGDVIDKQVADRRFEKSASTILGKEDAQIPALASISGIGTKLTVKFSTVDGVVSVAGSNSQINSHWTFLRKEEGLSVLIQNTSNKKVFRVTLMIPDDLEFGQSAKISTTATAVEMSIPPFPSQSAAPSLPSSLPSR